MEFRHLSDKFYKDYPNEKYPEIMSKENRPYTQIVTDVNGLKFAIPLRSDISHKKNVLWTNKPQKHGLDFTKAIPIIDEEYINDNKVFIRQDEHKHLLGKEHRVKEKMEKCIMDYKEAKLNLSIEHNAEFCSYCSLQYFEEYINKNEAENMDK